MASGGLIFLRLLCLLEEMLLVRILIFASALLLLAASLPTMTSIPAWQSGTVEPRFKESNAPAAGAVLETAPPGGRWTVLSPSPSEFQNYHSAAYDSKSGEIVVFGGGAQGYIFTNIWVYSYSTDKWTVKNPYPHPSAGVRAAIAYDSARDRFVVFGGQSPLGPSNQTWAYDLNTNVWTQMHPAVSPFARYWHTMAYDPSAGRVILFGGYVGTYGESPGFDETWSYDLGSNTWTNMNPSSKPIGRSGHVMAYDAQAQRIVLHGGKVPCNTNIVPNPSCISGETWAYDFASNAWTPRTTGPAAVDHAMAYDAQSNRLTFLRPDPAANWLSETWSYDYASDTWTKRSPASSPHGECCSPMVYDPVAARTVLFYSRWVWTYDLSSNNWSSRQLPSQPGYRWSYGLGYDSSAGQTILFGGYVGDLSGYTDGETWAYDSKTGAWNRLTPAVAPSARAEVGMTYVSHHNRTILFGGAREQAHLAVSDETWVFDYAQGSWSNPNPAVRPSARTLPGLAYDSRMDRVVLFGGAYPSTLPKRAADTWIFDPTNNTWTNVTGTKSPSAREGSAMAYDPRSGKEVLYGGITTDWPYVSNETWLYDVKTRQWTNATLADPPLVAGLASMAYDAAIDRMLLFGGPNDDIWSYDVANNTWIHLELVDQAPNAYPYGLVYDPKLDRVVTYGGVASDLTWSYIYAPPVLPGQITWSDSRLRGQGVWFSWLAPKVHGGAAITRYRIYRGTSQNEVTFVNATEITQYLDAPLECGLTYYYHVRAVTGAVEGPPSEALVIVTPPTGGIDSRLVLLIAVPAVVAAAIFGMILFFRRRQRDPPTGRFLVPDLKK